MPGVHLRPLKVDGTHLQLEQQQEQMPLIHGPSLQLEMLPVNQRTTSLLEKMTLARRGGPKRKRTKAK